MTDCVVTINEGQLRGKTARDFLGGTYYSFLGIPYAQPPVGELRFKNSVPVQPWDVIYDATKEGPECPSDHMLFQYFVGSEDNCLNLNVYTRTLPSDDKDSLKPVMVWIHGGGFIWGSNKQELFGPDYLITEDIVLVCVNYRLGVFGFLCLDDPSLEIPGNAGLKDIILALKWVKKNIESFNGDPNNVTIFGESAGGAAVHYIYLSPLSQGLFHKAIAQSGSAFSSWGRGCSNAKHIATALGYKEADEKKILELLMNESADKIVQGQRKCGSRFCARDIRPYGPVIEKSSGQYALLAEDPIDILKSGKFNHLPLIAGYTSREGIFYELIRSMEPKVDTKRDFEDEINHDLKLEKGSQESRAIARTIEKFYFEGSTYSVNDLTQQLYLLKTDSMFVHAIHRSICYQKMFNKAPIYMYRMSLETSLNLYKTLSTSKALHLLVSLYFLACKLNTSRAKTLLLKLASLIPKKSIIGVCHADDLGYLFKLSISPNISPGSIEESSIKKFVRMWTNFAKTGNPTPDKKDELLNVEWKPVTLEENNFLDIGETLTMDVNPDFERMKFWDDIYS